MELVKQAGAFEVFSNGAEEPWTVNRGGKFLRCVWTWAEVEKILKGEA